MGKGKKFAVLVMAAAMLLLCACTKAVEFKKSSPIPTLDPEGGWRTWATDNFEITAKYPHTWFSTENTIALMHLVSPAADATPDYREYIALGVLPNEKDKTAAQIADEAIVDMKKLYSGVELIKAEDAKIGEYDAQLRVFGGEIDDEENNMKGRFIWYQYTWLMGEKMSYSLTLSAMEETKEDYLQVFNDVIASLTLP